MTELIAALIEGAKYRVTYQNEEGQELQAVLRFMGVEGDMIIWSARPVVGPTDMPVSWFKSAERVLESTQPYYDRVV